MGYDAIIVGAGSMGASAADALARRGKRVLSIDRLTVPHGQGSHHGRTRMVRLAYYEHPDYVPLLRRSLELWNEFNLAAPRPLFLRTGGLYAGAPSGELLTGSFTSATTHALSHDRLPALEAARRLPGLALPYGFEALLEHDAGLAFPEETVRFLSQRARQYGATILENVRVLDWHETPEGVAVRTTDGVHEGGMLVVTGGAWTSALLPPLARSLRVTRQVLVWFRPTHPRPPGPVWAIEDPSLGVLYGFPPVPNEPGIKAAIHRPGPPCEPATVDRSIHPDDIVPIREGMDRYFPGVAGDLADACVCLYTNSPDGHFILDRVPGTRKVIVAAGFSGHGFKFVPVIGEILADLTEQGETRHPIAFLDADRLR